MACGQQGGAGGGPPGILVLPSARLSPCQFLAPTLKRHGTPFQASALPTSPCSP